MENNKSNILSRIGNAILLWGRKKVIGLKRNYYIIPMLFIIVAFAQFTFNLFIISPNATYIYPTVNDLVLNPSNYPSFNVADYPFEIATANFYALFVFLITLFSILYSVSFIFFIQNKNETKKKWFFFGLFFAVSLAVVVFEIFLRNITTLANYLNEYNLSVIASKGEDTQAAAKLVSDCNTVNKILLTNIILLVVSMVMVATSPLCQKLVKKIKFKRITTNEEQK